MKEQFFEGTEDIQHQINGNEAYSKYHELGGLINEKDYTDILARADKSPEFNKSLLRQAETIAKYAGIILDNSRGVDPKLKLYAMLRADNKTGDEEYQYSQMSDQRLFAEAIRMSADVDSLNKITAAYPNIFD